MKRFILFLLVGAMLLLPLSGCLADNNQNAGTTPDNTTESTTPEDTKPYYNPGPDETTPEATTSETTTPEETTPPENTSTETPQNEVITFTLKPFLSKIAWMPQNDVEVTIQNEDIFIYTSILPKSRNYTSCYVQNLKCNFPNEVDWHVDADEQALAVYEQIKSSTGGYMISTSSYPTTFNPIVVYYIDGTYYFVVLNNPEKANVYYIYYATIGEAKLPLSDKNTISSYPENSKPEQPTESDPLVIELFGEERIDFTAELTAVMKYFSDWSDLTFTVRDGNIYLADQYWCKISYADDIKVHFSQEVEGISDYKWFVEENEQMMQVIEKIANSDHCYVLDVQNFSYFNEVLMYDIDGDYYFVMRSASGTVKKLYRVTGN